VAIKSLHDIRFVDGHPSRPRCACRPCAARLARSHVLEL